MFGCSKVIERACIRTGRIGFPTLTVLADNPEAVARSSSVSCLGTRVHRHRDPDCSCSKDTPPIKGGVVAPRAKHDAYAGKIAALINDGSSDEALMHYLEWADVENMG